MLAYPDSIPVLPGPATRAGNGCRHRPSLLLYMMTVLLRECVRLSARPPSLDGARARVRECMMCVCLGCAVCSVSLQAGLVTVPADMRHAHLRARARGGMRVCRMHVERSALAWTMQARPGRPFAKRRCERVCWQAAHQALRSFTVPLSSNPICTSCSFQARLHQQARSTRCCTVSRCEQPDGGRPSAE